jgi:hypothetical protein
MAKRGFLFPAALHSLSIVGKPEQVNGNFQEVMAEGPQPKKEAPPPPAGEEGAYT